MSDSTQPRRAHRRAPRRGTAWADPIDLLSWPRGTERISAERLGDRRTATRPAAVAPLDPPEYRARSSS
jgi:hypothetical protein